MPIKSIIRETISLQGFRIESVDQFSFGISIKIVQDYRFNPRCGKCGNSRKYWDSRIKRQFKHIPIWGIPVMISYSPRRVCCNHCKGIYVEAIPWAAGKRRLTTAFACYLATWARILPWLEVGRLFQCAWGNVASAVDSVVKMV